MLNEVLEAVNCSVASFAGVIGWRWAFLGHGFFLLKRRKGQTEQTDGNDGGFLNPLRRNQKAAF